MKRLFDFFAALIGILVVGPFLLPVLVLIWLQDFASPFYIATRVACGGGAFRMVKLRSMVKNADKTGLFSTAGNDRRITWVGRFVRRYKLDEFGQLWNVLKGDMSLVGPRPQVPSEVALYTDEEKKLLDVRPGITDFSSIVFSDEGDVLADYPDADLAYNQYIRPWKSRLGLLYGRHSGLVLDIQLIFLTLIAIVSRPKALAQVARIVSSLGAPPELVAAAARIKPLVAAPPPGATEVIQKLTH